MYNEINTLFDEKSFQDYSRFMATYDKIDENNLKIVDFDKIKPGLHYIINNFEEGNINMEGFIVKNVTYTKNKSRVRLNGIIGEAYPDEDCETPVISNHSRETREILKTAYVKRPFVCFKNSAPNPLDEVFK